MLAWLKLRISALRRPTCTNVFIFYEKKLVSFNNSVSAMNSNCCIASAADYAVEVRAYSQVYTFY